jgi:hypothetical protein
MPASECEDDEEEGLYGVIGEIVEKCGKGATNSILMEGWNSVVGDKSCGYIVGSQGLERRNQRCEVLIDFCERNRLVITNTWFKKPKRRQYTSEAQGDQS